MSEVRLTLPEPPSTNRLWRNGRGRVYTSTAATEFKAAVRGAVLKAGITRPVFPEGQPVTLTITWYRARKAGDTSNRVKIVEDALNGVVWADDKQVAELHVYRIDGQRPGRCVVVVERAA